MSSPFVSGGCCSSGFSAGGLSASSRSHGLLTWLRRTLTSCSCWSRPLWFGGWALSSCCPWPLHGDELNARVVHASIGDWARARTGRHRELMMVLVHGVGVGVGSLPSWRGSLRRAQIISGPSGKAGSESLVRTLSENVLGKSSPVHEQVCMFGGGAWLVVPTNVDECYNQAGA